MFTPDGTGTAPSIAVADGSYTDLAGNLVQAMYLTVQTALSLIL
ncbi:RTX -containing domain protein [Acinetobacter baumannii 1499986]|uniref:RTX-containing domain protein n=1 Tax=Acinetobacter baumannii 1499986 TaxID=1310673 RepID=A0A836LXN0_ACIBA|nr:hypothetical protein [Acinetobacter baumannii]KCX98471.1 RTX -containing domain protein [Acinetobacter baumannii 1499986]